MEAREYTVVFTWDREDEGYIVTVPALPGLVTFGKDMHEAEEMAADAILCYLEGLKKDGEAFPDDVNTRPEVKRVAVSIAS